MDISIPEDVYFQTYETTRRVNLCFRHAIVRAMRGEDITAKCTDDAYYHRCNDCMEEEWRK